MKKIYYVFSVVVFVVICFICSCSKITKTTNNDVVKTNIETDSTLTELFNEFSYTLDGAYAEKYAYDLYESYKLTTPENFVYILSKQEINHVKRIIYLLVSEVINTEIESDIEEFTSIFKDLLDNKDLSKMEEYIVYDIYTNILFFQITI